MSLCISKPAIRRIAYATDWNSPSGLGLGWAMGLAQEYQAELLLLHVVRPPVPIFENESAKKCEAERTLGLLLAQFEHLNIRARGFLLIGTNSVDSQIVRAARLGHADLLMIGSPRSGLYKLLRGNVASRVINHAHCPVLVVPASDAEF